MNWNLWFFTGDVIGIYFIYLFFTVDITEKKNRFLYICIYNITECQLQYYSHHVASK